MVDELQKHFPSSSFIPAHALCDVMFQLFHYWVELSFELGLSLELDLAGECGKADAVSFLITDLKTQEATLDQPAPS